MWIFGYGSLMTDGWELNYDCMQRLVAELQGYRRTFNKASVVNWGTHSCPCPTLNLEPNPDAVCVGIAFEFPDSRRGEVEAYLAKREGKGFVLSSLEIIVRETGSVKALVPLYLGKNILSPTTTQKFLVSVQKAAGKSGACAQYIIGAHEQLAELGINDPVVTQLRDQLCAPGMRG